MELDSTITLECSIDFDVKYILMHLKWILDQLNDELHKALDTTAPLKLIQVAPCQKQPWFDEIVKARHKVV